MDAAVDLLLAACRHFNEEEWLSSWHVMGKIRRIYHNKWFVMAEYQIGMSPVTSRGSIKPPAGQLAGPDCLAEQSLKFLGLITVNERTRISHGNYVKHTKI